MPQTKLFCRDGYKKRNLSSSLARQKWSPPARTQQPAGLARLLLHGLETHETELAAGLDVYGEPMNLCIWAKNNGGMGSFYRSAHELIFLFKNGGASHRNNIQLAPLLDAESPRHQSDAVEDALN